MTNVVTIKSSGHAVVISERIADRERFENGRDTLEPGVEQSFIIHAGQSIRVVEIEAPIATPTLEPEAPAETVPPGREGGDEGAPQ